jgi:hypothetical protein
MQTSKVYIHRNKEGLWEVGVVLPMNGEATYINKHEAGTWEDAGNWVKTHYIA